eukprot:gene58148-biopygen22104
MSPAQVDAVAVLCGWCDVFRAARAPKLLRLLRAQSLLQTASPVEDRPKAGGFLFFLFWCAVATTWLMAGWLAVASDGMLAPKDGGADEGAELVSALYFVVVTITSVGFGDVFPHTTRQRWYVTFMMLCGLVFLVWIGAVSTAFILETDPVKTGIKERRRMFAAMIRELEIPWLLQRQCFAIIPSIVESGSYASLLDDLPPTVFL